VITDFLYDKFYLELYSRLLKEGDFAQQAIIDGSSSSSSVDDLFTDIIYIKSTLVINMIYSSLGGALFQQIIKKYLDKFKYSNASSRDFFDILNNSKLEYLFYEKGLNNISIKIDPKVDILFEILLASLSSMSSRKSLVSTLGCLTNYKDEKNILILELVLVYLELVNSMFFNYNVTIIFPNKNIVLNNELVNKYNNNLTIVDFDKLLNYMIGNNNSEDLVVTLSSTKSKKNLVKLLDVCFKTNISKDVVVLVVKTFSSKSLRVAEYYYIKKNWNVVYFKFKDDILLSKLVSYILSNLYDENILEDAALFFKSKNLGFKNIIELSIKEANRGVAFVKNNIEIILV